MKELEKENARPKRLVAELSLDKQIMKDVAEGNCKLNRADRVFWVWLSTIWSGWR